MPRNLTPVEEFFVKANAGKLSAEDIAKEIPGWEARSIQKYIDELSVIASAPEKLMDYEDDFTKVERYYIKDNFTAGMSAEKIADVLHKPDFMVKAFIASVMPTIGNSMFKKVTEKEKLGGVAILTEAASAHAEIMKEIAPPKPRDMTGILHKIKP